MDHRKKKRTQAENAQTENGTAEEAQARQSEQGGQEQEQEPHNVALAQNAQPQLPQNETAEAAATPDAAMQPAQAASARRTSPKVTVASTVAAVLIAVLTVWTIYANPNRPTVDEWEVISPEGAVSSDGSDWYGLIRLGDMDKVIILFYGGGMSSDEYMATTSGFYTTSLTGYGNVAYSIGSTSEENPFNDWTIIVVPYSTGDLHIGTGEFSYTDSDGEEQTLYHHGYTNFTLLMDEVVEYLDNPSTVLITGYSAGGFGAALLANDILSTYFPDAENTTVFVEAALLLNEDWPEIAEDIWEAPESIVERLSSDNIVLDSLQALSEDHPDTKILFSSSVRDGTLTKYQNYYDNGVFESTEEMGDVYQANLAEMVESLLELPNTGVLIWDDYAYDSETNLTWHTLLAISTFYEGDLGGITMADWVMDAVEGDVYSLGLELLEQEY